MAKNQTPAVPPDVKIRIRTRSPGGKPLSNTTVALDQPVKNAQTDARGFVTFSLKAAELGQITLRSKRRHFGPDPGAGGKVVPGEVSAEVTVNNAGFDPNTPGLSRDKTGPFLDFVLADAGLNFAAASPTIPVRRLTPDQVQKELMLHHKNATLLLDDASEFVFNHDPTSGEFDPCDPTKCTLSAPAFANRVGLRAPTIGGVTFFALTSFTPSPKRPADLIPGQRFIRDKFGWANMSLRLLDQRHVVGLARMCTMLNTQHSISALYTQGVSGDTTRADCHGYGQAIDLGGVALTAPDAADKNPRVRLGVDFIVFLHWGNVPMWDGTTVLTNPTDPTKWTRLTVIDDHKNYTTDTTIRLHYRLDPAPFQEAVPPTTPVDPALPPELAKIAPHFQTVGPLFQAIYDFATQEYTDANSTLGPLTPPATDPAATPIDSANGHFILHPDYPTPGGAKNGRTAHANHFHIQVGPTNFSAPRTT